jgi:hypothetical protein
VFGCRSLGPGGKSRTLGPTGKIAGPIQGVEEENEFIEERYVNQDYAGNVRRYTVYVIDGNGDRNRTTSFFYLDSCGTPKIHNIDFQINENWSPSGSVDNCGDLPQNC